jgi:hypothetical protein
MKANKKIKIVESKTLMGFMFDADFPDILRTNRAKEVCGDCETGDNSAQMIDLDGIIHVNYMDALKEHKRRGNVNGGFDTCRIVPVKITIDKLE